MYKNAQFLDLNQVKGGKLLPFVGQKRFNLNQNLDYKTLHNYRNYIRNDN